MGGGGGVMGGVIGLRFTVTGPNQRFGHSSGAVAVEVAVLGCPS